MGALTGFFGVGGVFVIVPVLTLWLGAPYRRAVGMSLVIIGLTGAAALASDLTAGERPDVAITATLAGRDERRHADRLAPRPARARRDAEPRLLAHRRNRRGSPCSSTSSPSAARPAPNRHRRPGHDAGLGSRARRHGPAPVIAPTITATAAAIPSGMPALASFGEWSTSRMPAK